MNEISVAILYTLIGLALSSFGYNPPSHVARAHKVMQRAQKKILSLYELEPSGIGEGMMGGVNSISFIFGMQQQLPREEVRKIAVGCAEILLAEVNNDPDIRPYLVEYPFTTKQARIMIHFSNDRGQDALYPYPCAVIVSKNEIMYCYMHSLDQLAYSKEVSESYEEALSIVKGDKPGLSPDAT